MEFTKEELGIIRTALCNASMKELGKAQAARDEAKEKGLEDTGSGFHYEQRNKMRHIIFQIDEHNDNEDNAITVVWSTDDVFTVIEDRELPYDITTAQAYEVLCLAKKWYDANYGITWDTLQSCLDTLYYDKRVKAVD